MEIPGFQFSENFKHAFKSKYEHQMMGSKLVLIILDLSNPNVERHLAFFIAETNKYCGDVPKIIVLNKTDIVIQKKLERMIGFLNKINQEYILTSVEKNEGFENLTKRIRDYTIII